MVVEKVPAQSFGRTGYLFSISRSSGKAQTCQAIYHENIINPWNVEYDVAVINLYFFLDWNGLIWYQISKQ